MDKKKPYLSIIVPIYNVEKYIRQCIDSILASNYTDFELLLIDDGSPDECGRICDEYALKDKRITVIHKKNGGVQGARNDGVEIANGEWITFVDADDYVKPDYFEKMTKQTCNDEVDLVFGNYYEVKQSKDDNWDENKVSNLKSFDVGVPEEINKIRAACFGAELAPQYTNKLFGTGYPWDKLYRTEIIKKNHLKFKNGIRGDDVLFCFQYMKYVHRAVCDSNIYGYCYRILPVSLSHGFVELSVLENTIHAFCGELKIENSEIVQQGLYVQMNRIVAGVLKRYFLNTQSGYSCLEGICKFLKWKVPYLKLIRRAKYKFLPLKIRIIRLVL